MRFLATIFIIAAILCTLSANAAADAQSNTRSRNELRPYCGLYCLYAAAYRESVPIPFERLLRQDYIKCPKGSSIAELAAAARDNGLHAQMMGGCSSRWLRGQSAPTILHARSQTYSAAFDHFVLFLGMDADNFMVLDPSSEGRRSISEGELLAYWDGIALTISASGPVQALIPSDWPVLAVLLIAFITLSVCSKRAPRMAWRLGTFSSHVLGCSVIVLGSSLIAIAVNRLQDSGILHPHGFLSEVNRACAPKFLTSLSLAEARAWSASGGIFIDAPYPADFASGHIPMAISTTAQLMPPAFRVTA